jgi:RNA polymerase sigma-70 factor (ECF subfamily)
LRADQHKDKNDLFRELFDAFYAKLHRYAFSIVKDSDVASDIVQTVYINLWRQRKELLSDDGIANYLYKSTYNRSLNYIRDKKTRDQHLAIVSKSGNTFTDNSGTNILARELSEKINEILEELPPQCQLIFKKSRLENKRYRDIALELNLSVKTIEAQIGKALRIFRENLKDYL